MKRVLELIRNKKDLIACGSVIAGTPAVYYYICKQEKHQQQGMLNIVNRKK